MTDQADTRTIEGMINVNLPIQKLKLVNPCLHNMIEKNTSKMNKMTGITKIIMVRPPKINHLFIVVSRLRMKMWDAMITNY